MNNTKAFDQAVLHQYDRQNFNHNHVPAFSFILVTHESCTQA